MRGREKESTLTLDDPLIGDKGDAVMQSSNRLEWGLAGAMNTMTFIQSADERLSHPLAKACPGDSSSSDNDCHPPVHP